MSQLKPKTYKDELDAALARASGHNKTLIIAIVNRAYVEGYKPMLDIFLDGLWLGEDTQGLKDHLLVGAMDQTSYRRCIFHGLHCYKLKTDGVDFVAEKLYMSDEFIKMMWRRTLFLGDVLKRGYNFIFTVYFIFIIIAKLDQLYLAKYNYCLISIFFLIRNFC